MIWVPIVLLVLVVSLVVWCISDEYKAYLRKEAEPVLDPQLARCRAEQAEAKRQLCAGAEPIDGPLLGFTDWIREEKLIQKEKTL